MKKRGENGELQFNYNEPQPSIPKHHLPVDQKFDFNKNIGIKARVLIEKALQSFEGVNLTNLKALDVTAKDLIKFRKEIQQALFAIIKEENGYDARLRSGAIAYLGALKINEGADIVASIALNPNENYHIRGYAVEALSRIKGETTEFALEKLIHDPVFIVREKAIRVLGKVGSKKHLATLKLMASKDPDSEIQFRAKAAMHFIETGKMLKRPDRKRNKEKTKTLYEAGNIRPIGRHGSVRPQTTFGDHGVWGGINLIATQEFEKIEKEKLIRPVVYEVMTGAPEEFTRLILRGSNIGDGAGSIEKGNIYKVHEDEIIVEFPQKTDLNSGCSLGLNLPGDRYSFQVTNWLPEAPNSPVIYSIQSEENVIWTGSKFGLRIKFSIPTTEKAALLRLFVKMPKDNWKVLHFSLSKSELAKGEKIISGFFAAIAGTIEINAALYTENGGACKFNDNLMALPANPISMNVSPSTVSTIGEGPAHYSSSEDKFYCYAQLRVINGFPHSVTLGPRVTARVTDGGTLKDNFSFNISTSTVSANSTRTIGVWMSFGGNTYDVFKKFGDVTIRLTLQTSEGDIIDSAVWAAMAQIKLALNFVGNFSATTRSQLQSAVDNEASAIYEQQNFFISDSARFLLPSTHSDFNRYRDIEMDDNKASDCTAGSDEADDLRDDWSSPNDTWLDVWLVESLSGPSCAASVGGFSPVNGPTGKGGSNSGVIIKMSSANLATTGGRNLMGIIIAHEVGHFLGLNHHGTSSNFMAASTSGSNTDITHQQYIDMAKHGFVKRFVI